MELQGSLAPRIRATGRRGDGGANVQTLQYSSEKTGSILTFQKATMIISLILLLMALIQMVIIAFAKTCSITFHMLLH